MRVTITTIWPIASSSRMDGASRVSRQPSWLSMKVGRFRVVATTMMISTIAIDSSREWSTVDSIRWPRVCRLGSTRRSVIVASPPVAVSLDLVAAAITFSGVASSRGMSAVIRPSQTTSTRSAMASTSGSSLEIIKMARPWPASSESSRCTSALVPMSMPRVGSSMISSVGFVASHLAMTTFCWLPPLMVAAFMSRALVFTARRAAQGPAALFSAAVVSRPALVRLPRITEETLRAMLPCSTRPCWRRSSGTNATPALMAARGS